MDRRKALGLMLGGFVLVAVILVNILRTSPKRPSPPSPLPKVNQNAAPLKPLSPVQQKALAAAQKRYAEAQREAQIEQVARIMMAQSLENNLLKAGVDLKCHSNEGKKQLLITGPSVNRVFVRQFRSIHTFNRALKKAGFKSISFWNGNQLLGIFAEDYYIE